MTPLLLQPLWPQAHGEARARRVRLLLAVPVVAILALAAAPLAGRAWELPYPGAAAVIVGGVLVVLYTSALLESLLVASLHGHARELSGFVPVLVDVAVGALIGRVLGRVVDVNLGAAAGIGAVALPAYNMIVAKLILGELGDALAFLFIPAGMRALPQYSLADALAARGDFAGALATLEREAQAHPRDAAALVHGARILRHHARRYEDAIVWLKRARVRLHRPSQLDATLTRELAELLLALDRPERARPELARLAATYPRTPAGTWAARELQRMAANQTGAGD